MKLRFAHLVSTAVLLTSATTVRGDSSAYGVYSNIAMNNGEMSGFEVFILNDGRPGKCNQSVLLQVAEGSPQYPELLDCCHCSAERIEFRSKEWGQFVGRIEGDHLVGQFVEAKHAIRLPRGLSIWQK